MYPIPSSRQMCGYVLLLYYHIGELGLEPRQTESESVVLPLDDSPTLVYVVVILNGSEGYIFTYTLRVAQSDIRFHFLVAGDRN